MVNYVFSVLSNLGVLMNDFSGGGVRLRNSQAALRISAAAKPRPVRRLAQDALEPGHLPLSEDFDELEMHFDAGSRALWVYMRPKGMPCFTPSLLDNLNRLHARLAADSLPLGGGRPLYFIGGSRVPGTFNLGGDLALFVDCIRAGDARRLRVCAHACVDAVHSCATGFGAPIVTIGLLEGNALGGGLEAALSFHVVVAERGVKFGFPETLFGSFPGMGAYSLVSRRIGMRDAEKLIRGGRTFTAEDFFEMGLVDILAEKGGGADAVQRYLAENRDRHGLAHAHNRIKQRMSPLPLEELYDVTDIWVETAMGISPADLRRMERLLWAQNRQGQPAPAGA